MKLTGKEALDYIQKNPNSGYKVADYGGIDPNEFNSYVSQFSKPAQAPQQSVDRFGLTQEVAQAITPAKPQEKDLLGKIGDFANNVLSPFRYIAEGGNVLANLAQGGTQLNDDPAVEKARMEFFSMPNEARQGVTFEDWYKQKGGDIYKNQYKPQFISQEEAQRAEEKPLETVVGETAKAASFFIPGGQGTGAAIKAGLASGGLQGFGDSIQRSDNIGDVIGDTVKGAAFGGATGGATSKLFSKLAPKVSGVADDVVNTLDNVVANEADDVARGGLTGKINEFGGNLRKSNLGIKADKTVTGALDKADLEDRILSIVDEAGEKANDVGIGNTYKKLSSKLSDDISKFDRPIDTTNILDEFTKQVEGVVNINKKDSVIQSNIDDALGKLSTLEKNPTAQQIADLKFKVQSEMSPIYRKNQQGNPLTPKETITETLHNVLDSNFKSQVPEVADTLSKMSSLHQAAPDIISQGTKGTKVGSPFLGASVNVGTPVSAIKEKVGKTLQNFEGGLKLPNAPKVPEQVSKFFGSPTGQKVADATERIARVAPAPEMAPQSAEELPVRQDLQAASFDAQAQQPAQSGMQLPPSMQKLFNQKQIDPDEKELFDFYSAGGGGDPFEYYKALRELRREKATAAQKVQGTTADQKTAKNLDGALNEMERLYGAGTGDSLSAGSNTVGIQGLFARPGQDIKKATNQGYTDKLNSYKSMAQLVIGMINQARGAGSLNAGEADILLQTMPNEYSSEQEAKDWFSNVRRILPNMDSLNG